MKVISEISSRSHCGAKSKPRLRGPKSPVMAKSVPTTYSSLAAQAAKRGWLSSPAQPASQQISAETISASRTLSIGLYPGTADPSAYAYLYGWISLWMHSPLSVSSSIISSSPSSSRQAWIELAPVPAPSLLALPVGCGCSWACWLGL